MKRHFGFQGDREGGAELPPEWMLALAGLLLICCGVLALAAAMVLS